MEGNVEFIIVNFELRAKLFIRKTLEEKRTLQSKSGEVQKMVEDKFFATLFKLTYNEMIEKDSENGGDRMIDFTGGRGAMHGGDIGSMQIYTS